MPTEAPAPTAPPATPLTQSVGAEIKADRSDRGRRLQRCTLAGEEPLA